MSEEQKEKAVRIGFMDDIIPILQASKIDKLPNGKMTFGINLEAIAHRYLMHTAMLLIANFDSLNDKLTEITDDKILRDSEKLHQISVLINDARNHASKQLETLTPKKEPEPSKIVGLDGKGL